VERSLRAAGRRILTAIYGEIVLRGRGIARRE